VLERHTLSSRRKTAAAFASRVLITTTTSPSLDKAVLISYLPCPERDKLVALSPNGGKAKNLVL